MIKSFRNHRFRRTFLINKDLQYRLLFTFFLYLSILRSFRVRIIHPFVY